MPHGEHLLVRPLAETVSVATPGGRVRLIGVGGMTAAFGATESGEVVWLPAQRSDGTWLPVVFANSSEAQFWACIRAADEILRNCPTPRLTDGEVDLTAELDVYERTAESLMVAIGFLDSRAAADGYWTEVKEDVAMGDWAEAGRG